jgi:integrase
MLTLKRIAKLRARPGKYLDEHGLILKVFSPKSASWFLRYQRHGRERYLGLGPLAAFTLSEARERARRARGLLADGIDPLEKKRAERARSISFEACAQAYYAAHERGWSNKKYRQQFLGLLRHHVFPRLGALPVAEIDEAMVLSVLKPIWSSKTHTARRMRHRIEKILDFATAAKFRSGDNPARWVTLQHLLARPDRINRTQHLPALPYAALPIFMSRLRDIKGVDARALEFTILTAGRSREVIGARWAEIDWEAATWVVPASRMKGRKEHRVPLSARALTLLRELYVEDGNAFVFLSARSGRGIGHTQMFRMLRALEERATVHGFRSSFSDWAHERTGHAPHTIEAALAHSIGNAVSQAYRRGDLFDKRHRLMNDWARYCESAPAAESAVAPLRSVRS